MISVSKETEIRVVNRINQIFYVLFVRKYSTLLLVDHLRTVVHCNIRLDFSSLAFLDITAPAVPLRVRSRRTDYYYY